MVYGLDFLLPLSRILAIWLCGAEMMMGCMIFCRVRLRLISIFALVSMSIFTFVTIMSVTFFPVEECGCFGDAFYLTPWQTLIKNLIILPMVFTIWWRYRPDKILVYKPREVILGTVFCVVCMGFSAFNYFNLPMIDYLPYKVGVDLLSEVESTTSDMQYSVVMVYRNIASGEIHEFSVDDTQWHDEEQWEWVDTRTKISGRMVKLSAGDIAIMSSEGEDATVDLLSQPGQLNLLAITDLNALRPRCRARVEEYVATAAAAGSTTIIVTPTSLDGRYVLIGDDSVECFNLDVTTFHGIMRSSVGVIELSDGVIVDKRSCINL